MGIMIFTPAEIAAMRINPATGKPETCRAKAYDALHRAGPLKLATLEYLTGITERHKSGSAAEKRYIKKVWNAAADMIAADPAGNASILIERLRSGGLEKWKTSAKT